MTNVTFIEHSGSERVIDAAPGLSLMEVAVANSVAGIVADCGGTCACGTCRIYVADEWVGPTGDASEMEEAMLEMRDDPTPGKRLACQILVTEELDGLVVRVPASQF